MQGMLRFRELVIQASRGLRTELLGSIHCFGCSALTPVEMGRCLCVCGGGGGGVVGVAVPPPVDGEALRLPP